MPVQGDDAVNHPLELSGCKQKAGGNHPEVPGSSNALYSLSKTHPTNSRQRDGQARPASSRACRRNEGNLSPGQTMGDGSDLPDRPGDEGQKVDQRDKPQSREALGLGEPGGGSSERALGRDSLFRASFASPGCQHRGPGDIQ